MAQRFRAIEPDAHGPPDVGDGDQIYGHTGCARVPEKEMFCQRTASRVFQSHYSVKDTLDRLVAAVEGAGLLVFARIDHAKNAAEIGTSLRPTELLVFGHPRGGTPLMLDQQISGIDLPVKALAWQDQDGQVWL